jgi:predicted GNAT family acetyltransferase
LADTPDIAHDPDGRRFHATVDGHEAFLKYALDGGVLVIRHTEVPEQIGGRGIAGVLVQATLQYARGQGLKVAPRCAYAAAYMRRHPEYADLAVA